MPLEPAPSRVTQKAGLFRFLEERAREKLTGAIGLLYAARETDAEAVWLRGKERHTGEPISAFYFGGGRSLDHVVDKLYIDYSIERRCVGLKIWSAQRWLNEVRNTVDICIADLPWPYYRLYARRGFLHLPGWIIQKIPLPDTWDGVLKRFRKNTRSTDLRKVRKYQLDYRLTSDPSDLETFYDTMFVPYVAQRFGKLSVVDDREDIVTAGKRGALLQVLHDQRAVAGVVVYQWRKTMHFLWVGLSSGLDAGLADAALSGIYLFSIQHAYAQGCTELNLSYTIPLLNDGVFKYKRKWGAVVHNGWRFGEIVIRPTTFGPGIQSFFARNPMIVRQGRQVVGKVLIESSVTEPVDVAKTIEAHLSDGLHCLKIFSVQQAGGHDASDASLLLNNSPVSFIELSAVDPQREFSER